ncbi:hypothetical protein [Promicromonospora sp. NPDC050249]|uniref:alpha/beta fold hydrolase n=1 Tax=Promicromonospora sp. NPDC050249 TaxID=3154743 RepID=UPI0033D1E198
MNHTPRRSPWRRTAWAAHFEASIRADQAGFTDFREDLAAFTVPTLVVHGDSDAVVPFHISGRRSAETISSRETTTS